MPLETLGDPKKLNIRQVEVTEPSPMEEAPFDVEAEMPPAVWEKIKEFCEGETSAEYIKDPSERERFKNKVENYRIDTVINLIQVFPKRRDELKNAIEKARTRVTERLAQTKKHQKTLVECSDGKNDFFDLFFDDYYRASLLSPEQPGIDRADIDLLIRYVRSTMTPGNWRDFLNLVNQLAVIAPEEAEKLKNDKSVFENCLKDECSPLSMRIAFPNLLPRKAVEKMEERAYDEGLVSNLRVYLPYIMDNNMKDMGDKENQVGAQDAPHHYAELLFSLKLLTSPSLKITHRGVIFEDRSAQDFQRDTPPLPETKKS